MATCDSSYMDKIIKLGIYFARSMQSIVVFLIVMCRKSSQKGNKNFMVSKRFISEM